jgi:hypothetical protein
MHISDPGFRIADGAIMIAYNHGSQHMYFLQVRKPFKNLGLCIASLIGRLIAPTGAHGLVRNALEMPSKHF